MTATNSKYVADQRREYSLYVLQQRAIPAITDGLKAGGRRVMWTARDGKKYKSTTLAGATMPIHPHAAPEGAINTLAAPYGNNIPLLTGDGAFGTLLNPTAYGASRYTSVKVSPFAKDVLYADIELVPMQDNYDGTLEEPVHFLPLIPISLLNPSEGIAVGFASTIIPRELSTIVKSQLAHLTNKPIRDELPAFIPTTQYAQEGIINDNGKMVKFIFRGEYKRTSASTVCITGLPYGLDHAKYIDYLMKLEEDDRITDFTDNSQDKYNIIIKFKRGELSKLTDAKLCKLLKLTTSVSENMNILDFDGEYILNGTYSQTIEDFTDWRLVWYKKRYVRLAKLLAIDIQRYKDILVAIAKNVGSAARTIQSRSELKAHLKTLGIVHLDYIADLPVYRFTQDEKNKIEKKLVDANILMAQYQTLISNPQERINVYIDELKTILKNYRKGTYTPGD